MIVCHCHQLTDRDIKSCIDRGADSLDAIADACGAASGCGGCAAEVQSLLFRHGRLLPIVSVVMDDLDVAS